MNTIFATATAPVKSGVAIIRISGQNASGALQALTGRTTLPAPRMAVLRKLYNPLNSEMIDEALVLYFPAPASFTGEDIVELHIHGSRAVAAELLACLGDMHGFHHAAPGEFSRRAFENGRMDLTEAEGLADLIDAETRIQARLALRQKQGELGRLYEKWREELLTALAYIEAYIDFPDEEIPGHVIKLIEGNIAQLLESVTAHLGDQRRGERLRNGLSVVILGPPNAGKSSLINLLAMRDVAIVSEHAGTTRDIIEVHLDVGGYPVIIADTAGIHDKAGDIESEGIKRALARAGDADLKIFVLDAEGTQDTEEYSTTWPLLPKLPGEQGEQPKNTIIVLNKTDLLEDSLVSPQIAGSNTIRASFKYGKGIEEILAAIRKFAEENFNITGDPMITSQRHRVLLQEAQSYLGRFSLHKEIELAAEDLRCAGVAIGRITGRIHVEEVLDKIFSSFCIGK